MADKVGDEFEGYITGVAAFGLFIQLIEHYVEGLVHVSTMADAYYRFVEPAHLLRGENTQKVYRLGDKVGQEVVGGNNERALAELGAVALLDVCRGWGDRPRRSPAMPTKDNRPKEGARRRVP